MIKFIPKIKGILVGGSALIHLGLTSYVNYKVI